MTDTPPGSEEELRVAFKLEADDVRAIAKILLWRLHGSKVVVLLVVGALGIAWSAAMTFVPSLRPAAFEKAVHTPLYDYGMPIAVVLGVLLLAGPAATKSAVTRAQRAGTLKAEHVVRISKGGVFSSATGMRETSRPWKLVHAVEATKDFILIFGSAHHAHAIPRRAFRSQAEATRFLDRAKAWFDEARRSG